MQLELQVGKKYTVRRSDTVLYVLVDMIRPDSRLGDCQAVGTMYYKDGGIDHHSCTTDGRFYAGEFDAHDLVAEYTEPAKPALVLGPWHVGRRVRLRNGDTALLLGYYPSRASPRRVTSEFDTYFKDGSSSSGNSDRDILEVLDV